VVDLLLVEGDRADEAREAEAGAIAELVRETVAAGEFRHGEIAVLLRAFTNVKTYERAFEMAEVPYYVVKGRGFYEAREVVDLIRLLECVRNPRGDLALAAALRSPFGGLSEDGLLALAMRRDARGGDARLADLLEGAEGVKGLRAEDRERWLAFASLLHGLRRLAGRASLREVIESALSESGYGEAVWLLSGARRRSANFRKVLDLAESLEGVFDLSEFLARLREFRVREVQETEAPTGGEREDVVRLLTVHAAKGLEFPMVILPDLCRAPYRGGPGIRVGGGILASRVLPGPGEDSLATNRFEEQKGADRNREAEESVRLLYVAVTRAMRRLVLSARCGEGSAECWWSLLRSSLGEGYAYGPEGERAVRVREVGKESSARRRSRSLLSRRRKELSRARPLPGVSDENRARAEEIANTLRRTAPEPDGSSYQNTITELATYDDCPRCYVERYRLGIPAGEDRSLSPEEAPEVERPGFDELPPTERGSAVHAVLFGHDPHGTASFAETAPACRPAAAPGLLADVAAMAERFYESSIGEEVLRAPPESVRREVPFLVRWPPGEGGGLLLRGQIDLLYPRETGGLVIVDYKTGRTAPVRYETQLVAYAEALGVFLDDPVVAAYVVSLDPEAPARVHPVELGPDARKRVATAARAFAAFLAAGAPLPKRHAGGCPRAT
jgi:ATP-dependent helicase/nuclease subunit A